LDQFAPANIPEQERQLAASNPSIILLLLNRANPASDAVTREAGAFFASDILDAIQQRYMNCGLSFADVSTATGISPRQIARLLKSHTGYTFTEYVRRLRIEAAQHKLLTCNANIRTICLEIGYIQPSWFARHFRMLTGLTPSQYRKQQRALLAAM
jgi:AraC-like DNA-binding protein